MHIKFTMNDKKVLFSVHEDEKLVEYIAKRPCLYDVSSPLYKNYSAKEKYWKEVGHHVKRTPEDCKKRWRNIRDTYNKRKKKIIGTGRSKPKPWILADMLTFLEKSEDKIQNAEETEDGENEEEEEGNDSSEAGEGDLTSQEVESLDLSNFPSRSTNKRQKIEETSEEKHRILKSINESYEDDVDLFFRSIAFSVKKLPPVLIYEAKFKSLKMVFELENRSSIKHSPSSSAASFDF